MSVCPFDIFPNEKDGLSCFEMTFPWHSFSTFNSKQINFSTKMEFVDYSKRFFPFGIEYAEILGYWLFPNSEWDHRKKQPFISFLVSQRFILHTSQAPSILSAEFLCLLLHILEWHLSSTWLFSGFSALALPFFLLLFSQFWVDIRTLGKTQKQLGYRTFSWNPVVAKCLPGDHQLSLYSQTFSQGSAVVFSLGGAAAAALGALSSCCQP